MRISFGRRYRRGNPLLVGVIFFFVGLIFCIVAAVLWFSNQSFLAGSVSTTGQIVSCRYSSSTSGSGSSTTTTTTCQPTITFTTQAGQKITFTSSSSSSSYNEGDSVTINYHPNHPADARIEDFITIWLLPLIFGGLGSIFVIIGLCLTVIPLLFKLLLIRGTNNNTGYAGSGPYNNIYTGAEQYNSYQQAEQYNSYVSEEAYNRNRENEQYNGEVEEEEYNKETENGQ